MSYRLSRISKPVRDFLFSSVNREFLIFLFFLALSGAFWLLMALNETYEKELSVPVCWTNIPENAVVTSELEDSMHIIVRDKGYTLITYVYGDRLKPIKIDFSAYANKDTGYGIVPTSDILKQIYVLLSGSSRIVAIKPERVDFYFNYGLSKRVPIRIAGSVVPAENYYIARMHFKPEMVTIYASKHLLDSIKYVTTDRLHIVNFSDTVVRKVSLKKIRGVKIVPNTVRMSLYPDVFTDESIEVPITAVNMPDGKVLRTFPSRVTVNFIVGASMYRTIKPEQFTVIADYNDLAAHPSDKCNLYVRTVPHGVKQASLSIQQVDYLIEQQ